MKVTIILFALTVLLYSCGKDSNVKPDTGTTTTAATSTTDVSTIKNAAIFYQPQDQAVTTYVNNLQLTFTYTEKVTLLIDSAKYHNSWYVYFAEDWSKTALANLDYTTLSSWGVTATNYVPNNLNQITKTEKDTMIARLPVAKVSFARTFNFIRSFASNQAALRQQDSLTKVTDHVIFTTKYLPMADTTLHNSVTLNVKYSKN